MPSVRSKKDRLARLERFTSDRYRDVAIRLRDRSTSELGPIHGGRWDVFERRYLAPWELLYQELSATTPDALERARLHVAVRPVTPDQRDFCEDLTTKILAAQGTRRAGKSSGGATKCAVISAERPGEHGEVVSPTFDKSQIMQQYVRRAIPAEWIAESKMHEHWLRLWTGTKIKFISAHKPDSVIAEGVNWIDFDELQSISEAAWSFALPAASDGGRNFQVFAQFTPRRGQFKQRYERIRALEAQGLARIIPFSYKRNSFIDSGEGSIFSVARALIDQTKAAQELDGEFVSEEGLVFHRFDRRKHDRNWTELQRRQATPWARDITTSWLRDELETELHPRFAIGVDYGMGRQFAVVYRVVKHGGLICLWAVAEVYREKNYDAEDLAFELVSRGFYPAAIFDDASGPKSQGGKQSRFRFDELRVAKGQVVQLGGEKVFEVFHRGRAPDVEDRVDATNALMCNALGQVRWFVDVGACPRLVECLENHEYSGGKPKKNRKDEVQYHDMPDAASYPVIFLFPADVEYERLERSMASA